MGPVAPGRGMPASSSTEFSGGEPQDQWPIKPQAKTRNPTPESSSALSGAPIGTLIDGGIVSWVIEGTIVDVEPLAEIAEPSPLNNLDSPVSPCQDNRHQR
jgi:hypothetical protein